MNDLPQNPPDLLPAGEQTAVATKNGRGLILVGVGLVALLVAAIGGAIALRGSSSDSGGADSPEAAVQQMLDAIGDEDVLAMAELLLPSERQTMIEPMIDMTDELKRLEILSADMDMSSISGVDFTFDNVVLRSEEIRPGMTAVHLESGTSSATVIETELPLGRLVLDRLPAGTLSAEPETSVSEADPSEEAAIVAVERDGRWFVSMWYSVAEAARVEAGLPLPDLNERIVARGEATPEAAVHTLFDSAIDLDLRRVIELLPPDEAEALHDYAPLFIDDAVTAANDARSALDGNDFGLDISRLDLRSTERRGGHVVFIDGGAVSLTADGLTAEIDWNADGLSAWMEVENEGRMEATYVDDCIELTVTQNGETQTERLCEDEIMAELALEDLDLPDFNIFSTTPEFGIMTVERDGLWYVSPLGTMSDSQVEVLAAIDQQKLEDLIDFFIDVAESQDGF